MYWSSGEAPQCRGLAGSQGLVTLWVLGSALIGCPSALALPPGFTLQLVHSDLDVPATLRFSPDGRLFYTEYYTGRVMVYPTGDAASATVWGSVPVARGGDRGLQSMAFHPEFPDSPYVYLFHTNMAPEFNRIVRMTDQDGVGGEYTVLVDSLAAAPRIHHGGRLAFGPDGLLYATTGDQSHPEYSRDPSRTEGKILRYNAMGRPAPDVSGLPPSPLFARGLRNPFGICFDPLKGDGYFTEVGPECDDEVNLLLAGADYGWGPDDECGSQPAGTEPALLSFAVPVTPTGCCVYRGVNALEMDGSLFFGGWNYASVYRAILIPGEPPAVHTLESFVEFPGFPDFVLDVTQGADGELWVSTYRNIWRVKWPDLTASALPPKPGDNFSAGPSPFVSHLEIHLPVDCPSGIEILDAGGRRVVALPATGSHSMVWDGRSESGAEAPAGIYWVRLGGRSSNATRRVVKLGR